MLKFYRKKTKQLYRRSICFNPIVAITMKSIIIVTFGWLGELEVTQRTAVPGAPGSIPGTDKDFMFWFKNNYLS